MALDPRVAMRIAQLVVLLVGCHSGDPVDRLDAPPVILGDPCSVDHVTGTLPGVDISISSERCVYQRGEPARFVYRVTTTSSVPAIDVPAASSCSCDYRSTEIASWVSWTISGTSDGGDAQQYCVCDTGCCAPQAAQTITPAVGMLEDTIDWSGRTWFGPSDTGNQQGDYFRVGHYDVIVAFAGYDHGFVEAKLPIEIVAR